MFNVAVLKLKDIIKYFIGIILLLLTIIVTTKYFSSSNKNIEELPKKAEVISTAISQNNLLKCIETTLPVISNINKDISNTNNKKNDKNILQEMLKTELSSIKEIERIEEKAQIDEKKEINTETMEKDEKKETQEVESSIISEVRSGKNWTSDTSSDSKSTNREF